MIALLSLLLSLFGAHAHPAPPTALTAVTTPHMETSSHTGPGTLTDTPVGPVHISWGPTLNQP